MKKIRILSLMLACIAAISSFTACGGNKDDLADTSTADTDAATELQTDASTDDASNGEQYDVITVAEALQLCGEEGNITSERYYIRASVISIDNAQYGAMTVSDGTGTISVYGTYSADGSKNYSEMTDVPYAGDEVLLWCVLQNFKGTKEVKNAYLIEFEKKAPVYDESKYTEMTVQQARNAEKGVCVKVDGVVAKITYAFGMVPSGVYLIDETQSIYVYDSDLAQRVKIGDQITVCAEKTYWILESEQSNAAKYGYKGCNQLENAILVSDPVSSDEGFDKSLIPESTVKKMLDTPVTEDITTSVFKVNALVKKSEGTGFNNYYFYDLDGKTGSYTYTQCNGSDFAYLDEFDGKICTVYLSVINAKSTSSGCLYRFIPIHVEDNGFSFDSKNVPEHVVEYYGIDQFLSEYSADPQLELITLVSSELLGFENARITYSSNDESIVKFDTAADKTVMHCLNNGTAEITVACEYNGASYEEKLSMTVKSNESVEYITVKEAISQENGTSVTVKGIVGPSLVNQSGFYLIDDSGVVAALIDSALFDEISIGDEIILRGTKGVKHKDGSASFGQTNISNCEILANYYGDNEYSTASFKNLTLADFYALNVQEDHSTDVYVMQAKVKLEKTQYYTNIKLTDGDKSITLYCSSAAQYSWLGGYDGQTVTVEISPCNWNGKNFYAGCVLAVYTGDQETEKTLNELNFAS